jgi:hypothetical protein
VSALTASLAGAPVVYGNVVLPAVGIWHADLVLDSSPTLGQRMTLALSGATLTCSVIRQASFAGRTECRVVGGAAGWRMAVPPKLYSQPLASSVLSDVAGTVGELINVAPAAANLLPDYVRTADLASKVLQDLYPDAWWMDLTGMMQLTPRPTSPIGSQFDVVRVRGESGLYTIATDTPGDWLPGATFVGPTLSALATISRVRHEIKSGKLRTEVLAS